MKHTMVWMMSKDELQGFIGNIYRREYLFFRYEEQKTIFVPYVETRPLLSYERILAFCNGAIIYNLTKDILYDCMENKLLPQGNYLIF